MRKVCGNIFEDRKRQNVQLNLNDHQRFSQIFRLYDDLFEDVVCKQNELH